MLELLTTTMRWFGFTFGRLKVRTGFGQLRIVGLDLQANTNGYGSVIGRVNFWGYGFQVVQKKFTVLVLSHYCNGLVIKKKFYCLTGH